MNKDIDWEIIEIANKNAKKLEESHKKQQVKSLYDYDDDEDDKTDILLFFGIVFTLIVIGSMLGVWQ